jgi:hypothetical protein
MSELGDLFKDWTKHRKAFKANRAVENLKFLQESGIKAEFIQEGVYRVGEYMYYPGSNKWQRKGIVIKGNVKAFKNWLAKQKSLNQQ